MDVFGLGEGFYCETCGGYGGLQIGHVIHLELTCPTCHGESRGMPLEQFMDELAQDARDNRDFRDEHWGN
jgi:hypothetical protein